MNDWYDETKQNYLNRTLLIEVHSNDIVVILDGSFCEDGAAFHTKGEPTIIPEFSIVEYSFDESKLNDGKQDYYTGAAVSIYR